MAGTMALTAALAKPAQAQDETDALRFGYLAPQGTARSIGFGSALGSVGGDFSSLSVNPAGIGVYRRGEITFTPSLRLNNTEGSFLGTKMDDDVTRFNISNFGIVATKSAKGNRYDKSRWKSVSFGFGINRVADFNRSYTYGGYTTQSSGSERYKIDANDNYNYFLQNGNLPQGSLGYLGYNSYLLDTFQGQFETIVDYSKGINQRRIVSEKGGMNEMVISVGGNYEEKLMLGATLGLPIVRYIRSVSYLENDANNQIPYFTDFTYSEDLRTTGIGVNLKLGAIYKPSEYFRIGAAFHTPTLLSLHDEFSAGIVANSEDVGRQSSSTPENQFDYSLTTPWRGILSATAMLGQYGFFTVDYEYVNYRSMRYNFNTNDNEFYFGSGAFSEQERAVNDAIKNTYQAASNIRGGLEIRLDNFMLRTGVGYYGSPYKNDHGANANRIDISGGIGFRGKHAFADIAYVHSSYESAEQPYTLPYQSIVVPVPYATIKNSLNNVVLTMGVKF